MTHVVDGTCNLHHERKCFDGENRNQYLFSIVHEENEVVTGQMKCLHNDWITQLELGHCDT